MQMPRKMPSSAPEAGLQPAADQEMKSMLTEVLGMGREGEEEEEGDEGAEEQQQQQQQQRGAGPSVSRWARVRGLGAFVGATAAARDKAGGPRRRRRQPEPLQNLVAWTERLREWMAYRCGRAGERLRTRLCVSSHVRVGEGSMGAWGVWAACCLLEGLQVWMRLRGARAVELQPPNSPPPRPPFWSLPAG
jgi:hypothetical protein